MGNYVAFIVRIDAASSFLLDSMNLKFILVQHHGMTQEYSELIISTHALMIDHVTN